MLKISRIQKSKNTISVYFEYDEEWAKYLKQNYISNTYDVSIESVPDGIAIIPTLCNLLPIAWLFGLKIECDEIDERFNFAIENILDGYKKMYPKIKFGGGVRVKETNSYSYEANKSGVLFSGGVDATTTALRHLKEKPDVITVYGADIKLSDKTGINNVNRLNLNFSKNYSLPYERVFSTFRQFLNESKLQEEVKAIDQSYGWWHEFQHGIGLIGLVAPLAYVKGYKKVYIASSFHKSQWGQYTCASDPVIDNMVRYGKTITIHDGYDLTRTEKIRYICNFIKTDNRKPYLRVCWESSGGRNCCHCEKCRRTYLGILAEKANPRDFGLDFSKKQISRMITWYKGHLPYNYDKMAPAIYNPIKQSFIRNYNESDMPENFEWIRTTEIGAKPFPLWRKLIDKVARRATYIAKKLNVFKGI